MSCFQQMLASPSPSSGSGDHTLHFYCGHPMSWILKTVSCEGSGEAHAEEDWGARQLFWNEAGGDGWIWCCCGWRASPLIAPTPIALLYQCQEYLELLWAVRDVSWAGHGPSSTRWASWGSCSISAAPPGAPHITQLCPASASHLDLYIPITSSTRRCAQSAKFH